VLALWPALCAAGIAMAVYVLTMAPSLVWSHWGTDGGDFVAAAVTGRVPHPPGFPVYLWISGIAVGVASGDPARALNFLSALMASGTAALTTATALRRGISMWGAVATGLTLAFAPWLWSQAVITEVYTSAAFFAGLTLFLAEVARDKGRSFWLLVGLSLGLAMAVHPTVAFLGVAVAVGTGVAWSWFAPGIVLGLLNYGFLAVSGPWPQPWGNLSSFMGWVEFVSARMYWGNAFSLPAIYWPERVLAWLVLIVRQFTPFGLLLACLGLVQVWRRHRSKALGLLGAFALAAFYAIGYDSADSWVYLIAYLPVMALALGSGFSRLEAHRVPAYLSLLLPTVLLAVNWQQMDLHSDRDAVVWLADTLAQLPPEAVVVTSVDQHTFALWYAVDVDRARPDLTVVDRRLWGYVPYNGFLARSGPSPSDSAQSHRALEVFVGDRPLCEIDAEGGIACR
jgi:hypothetical protein